jgi:hypothetical protein
VKTQVSEIKTSSEKMESPIDYCLLDDYFPQKEEKENVLETKEKKRKNFDMLFGLKSELPHKK